MVDEFEDPGEIENPNEVKRDRWDRPMLPPVNTAVVKADGDESPKTRVTTFAGSLDEQSNLSLWSQRLVAKGMAERPDLRMLARSATLEDKSTLNEVISAAKELAGGPASARMGTALHSFTELRDRGGSDALIDPEFLAHVDAYSTALTEHGIEILPEYIERLCCWEKYSVAGTFDRIVMWKGRPTVLDLKTGKDLGYGWLKIAVQLLCYASADGIWQQSSYSWLPMPENLRTDVGLVVHLPATGDAVCSVYEVDLTPVVDAARLCFEVREWRKQKNLAVKLKPAPPVQMPGLGNREVRLRSDGVEVKTLSAQITESVLAGNAAAQETACTHGPMCQSCKPTGPKKRGRPRKLASVPPPVEPLAFDEPLADVDAVSETDSGIRVSIEVLEGATLDETIKAAETEQMNEAVTDLAPVLGDEEPADPFADIDASPFTPEEEAEHDASVGLPTPQEIIITRINEAMGHADLSQIRKEALADGLWTDEMLKLGMARLESLK